MATAVVMPKLGNSVESSIIVAWHKKPGDTVHIGDVLCEVETDKSVLEVPAPADGVLLRQYFNAGDDVPVMSTIGLIGVPGEAEPSPHLEPAAPPTPAPRIQPAATRPAPQASPHPVANGSNGAAPAEASTTAAPHFISPRARLLAEQQSVDIAPIRGSGPGGRVIERDIRAYLDQRPPLTPLARAQGAALPIPAEGTGIGGRVTAADRHAEVRPPIPMTTAPDADPNILERIPLKGVRKVIAERMAASLRDSAQLTLHAAADARAMQAYRKRLKESDPGLGLAGITINDLILFATARTLIAFPELNSTFQDNVIVRYRAVNLGFAVDTPRGLLVPVIMGAEGRTLRALALEAKRLAEGAQAANLPPDLLSGGTFTVTNLGSLGIDSFTPIVNPPQVAILGVGGIVLRPIEADGAVQFIPHLQLSLTIDHQVIDGAPGARFLAALCKNLAAIDLMAAL
jgi:pyruvate dehydrogenase E2 component (dihydrolipoamide acetyltransferase)